MSGVMAGVRADVLRFLDKSPENRAAGARFKSVASAFLRPEIAALFVYRLSHFLERTGWPRLAAGLSRANFALHKVLIPPQSCIGPGCRLSHPAGVSFDGRAGERLTLFSLAACVRSVSPAGESARGGPTLGDRVTVGAHAVVLGPVTVGDDTTIAHSVRLDRDAPGAVLVVSRSLRLNFTPRMPARIA